MNGSKRRVSARLAALFIVLMMIAVPAAATAITQNFMRADVVAGAACFVKLPGADAALPDVTFDATPTITSGNGVTLLQERLTVTGYAGDRVTYTDVARYRNNCTYNLDVSLRAEADPEGNPALEFDWADKYAALYLGALAAPQTDPLIPPAWSPNFIEVQGAAITNFTAGSVTLTPGTEVQLAVVVETDAVPVGDGTLRFTAEARNS